MPYFNTVTLLGNVCRDPELRFTPSGLAIATVSLALNRKWKDSQSGELKEEVSFIDSTAFGKSAENIGKYVKKGDPLLIHGRLKQDTWEDKQTHEKRSKVCVVIETFVLLGGKREPGEEGQGQGRQSQPSGQASQGGGKPASQQDAPPAPEDDDVPF